MDDDGKPIGLENDLKLVKNNDLDGYQLWLTDLFERCLGRTAATLVRVGFPEIEGVTICRVEVGLSPYPVFVNPDGDSNTADFYVRIGNSTRKLSTDEVLKYKETRWK